MSDSTTHPWRGRLPEYAAGLGTEAERAAIARHLTECAICRAELAEWQHVRAATQATAPQPPTDFAGNRTRQAIFAHIAQANHTGGLLMSSDPIDADATPAPNTLSPRVPDVMHRGNPAARWVAVSLALALVVGLAAVLAQLHKSGAGSHTTDGSSTTTISTTTAVGTPPLRGGYGTCPPEDVQPPITRAIELTDLAMVSPTEGWAVGGVAQFGLAPMQGTLLHLVNGQWLNDTDLGSAPGIGSIAMTSPTDGWLTYSAPAASQNDSTTSPAEAGLAHYDGQHWHAVPLPDSLVFDTIQPFPRLIVRMASATNGWIFPFQVQPNGPAVFLHYNGTAWQPVTAPFPSSLTPPKFYQFYDLAITGPDELWVIGDYTDDAGGGQTMVIVHYLNGQWSQVPNLGTGTLDTIAMTTPTDGWIAGHGGAGYHQVLLHYDGTTWQSVATPAPLNDANANVAALTAGPDGTIWGLLFDNITFTDAQIVHLVNGQWQTQMIPNPTTDHNQQFTAGKVIPLANGDLWVVGDILHQRGCPPVETSELGQGVILQQHAGQWNSTIEPTS
jgi:hypothetical protein